LNSLTSTLSQGEEARKKYQCALFVFLSLTRERRKVRVE